MAGNSRRRGAMRKPGTKKGAVVGSGGQKSKRLQGKGPTPKAENRTGHPAARRARAAAKHSGKNGSKGPAAKNAAAKGPAAKADAARQRRKGGQDRTPELVAGRNPVAECLRAGAPATALYVALGVEADERVTEAVHLAAERGVSVLEVSRSELDRLTGGALHQGLALSVPPFEYTHPDDLLSMAAESGEPPLLVALDGVTDPRNLGAVIRSAAAFGAHGLLLPARRSAGVTAVAWRTSAGTAANLPIAVATNLTRTLRSLASEGVMIIGLDADGTISSDGIELATGPLVVVVGSEGRGLSRLVRDTCDETVSIPMATGVESLNASVAASVVLAEVARIRRTAHRV